MQVSSAEPKTYDMFNVLKQVHARQSTGILEIMLADGQVAVHLRCGTIVNVEIPRGIEWVLGDYLRQGGEVSQRGLMKALEEGSRRGVSPEQVLVERGRVTRDVLKRYYEVALRETILPLFAAGPLHVRLLNQEPVDNPLMPSLPIPYLLKEGERQVKEWPTIRARVPSLAVVFGKDPGFVKALVGGGDSGMESQLFSDRGEGGLGATERIVYYHLDGKTPVGQLARRAGLDTFSACRALVQLEARGIVRVLRLDGITTRVESSLLGRIATWFAYAVLIVLLWTIVLARPGTFKYFTFEEKWDTEYVSDLVKNSQLHEMQRSVNAAFLVGDHCGSGLQKAYRNGFFSSEAAAGFRLTCSDTDGFSIEEVRGP